MKNDTQKQIIARLTELLDQGIAPWQVPWHVGQPRNLATGHIYTGYNALILGMQHFESEYYVTFQQAKELGGFIRKREHGIKVIRPNFYVKTQTDDSGHETKVTRLSGFTEYAVFNVTQCEGIKVPERAKKTVLEAVEAAQALWDNWQDKPVLNHFGNRAYWQPATDSITLPHVKNFRSSSDYFSTLFHEATHATGHETRLNRESVKGYSTSMEIRGYEELVAEIGACFLCGTAGIVDRTIQNSAAYIGYWKQFLRDNPDAFLKATRDAQVAVDWITEGEAEAEEV